MIRQMASSIAASLAACGLLAALMISGQGGPAAPPSAPSDAPTSPVAALVESHHCWRTAAPPDVRPPGHAVVTLPSGRVAYGGTRLTRRALEQQFNGVDHGLTVWAFCR